MIYARFTKDIHTGYISILHFFNYILRRVSLLQARLDLSLYDVKNEGVLSEQVMLGFSIYFVFFLQKKARVENFVGTPKLYFRLDAFFTFNQI